MNPGICALSAIPVRAEASDKAELVTELLFGDCYTVLVRQGNWLRVESAADKYQGWIDYKQHTPVSAEYFSGVAGARPPARPRPGAGSVLMQLRGSPSRWAVGCPSSME